MKFLIGSDHYLYLLNFSNAERLNFVVSSHEIFRVTAGKYGFPDLRSQEIYVFRNVFDTPRYLSEPASEFISVNAGENDWLQFAYQLAHETGHLMAQSWQRHQKPGHHSWLEEAVCGAYTIYGLRELSKNQAAQGPAHDYLTTVEQEYSQDTVVDAAWYGTNEKHLAASTTLIDIIKPLSRLIADEFPDGKFILDNMALIGMPPILEVAEYLQQWEKKCAGDSSVPAFLLSRLAITDR